MRTITVNEYSAMPNRYTISFRDDQDEKSYSTDKHGEAAAAAQAMHYALACDEYVIFGNKKVLACIPDHMRAKKFSN